jgi:hypothetical protein
MARTTHIPIESAFGVTLHQEYYASDPRSDKLMILLPGKGYTVNSPLFHYIKPIGIKYGFDVLSINYAIHLMPVDNWIMRIPDIHADTQKTLEQVLDHDYQTVCIVGKSLGTPLAASIANQLTAPNKSVLMLTPIQAAVSMVNNVRTLGIIGTADPAYDANMILETDTQSWMVLEGLNHSLEYRNDRDKSLDILKEILSTCETFIKESASS